MNQKNSLAFDIFGTIIDTSGLLSKIKKIVNNSQLALEIINKWREKQLEYTYRRALMNQYVSFSQCTQEALITINQQYNNPLSPADIKTLISNYNELPKYNDVENCLKKCQSLGLQINAFSNGEYQQIETLLKSNQIIQYFEKIVSVESVRTFKPNPKVYQFFIQECQADIHNTWLISGNPFDIIGAKTVGYKCIWINRKNTSFEYWKNDKQEIITPNFSINSLEELEAIINN